METIPERGQIRRLFLHSYAPFTKRTVCPRSGMVSRNRPSSTNGPGYGSSSY